MAQGSDANHASEVSGTCANTVLYSSFYFRMNTGTCSSYHVPTYHNPSLGFQLMKAFFHKASFSCHDLLVFPEIPSFPSSFAPMSSGFFNAELLILSQCPSKSTICCSGFGTFGREKGSFSRVWFGSPPCRGAISVGSDYY